tara:strand:+ start:573 stop:911 length:339 start_codon:yes stop_codon:yes gene_type:complete
MNEEHGDINVLVLEGVLAANRGIDGVAFLRSQSVRTREWLSQRLTRRWEGRDDAWVYDFCLCFLDALREEMQVKCSCGRVGTWTGDPKVGEPKHMCSACVAPYKTEEEQIHE